MRLDNLVISWKCGSSHLVSLLDMIKFSVEDFCVVMCKLEELLKKIDCSLPRLTDNNMGQIDKILNRVSIWCKIFELEGTQAIINDIESPLFYWWIKSPVEAKERISLLRDIINTELNKCLFMYIQKEKTQWYENDNGFGEKVSESFPSAIDDIKEAGTCYAAERYTACVFHLMRVLEYGLKALAKDVGLSFDIEQWYDIIGKIEKEIKRLAQILHKSIEKNERLKFLFEAAKEFTYFKDGWRNYVSHNRSNYDGPQAFSALNHVSAFMAHLATKLKE